MKTLKTRVAGFLVVAAAVSSVALPGPALAAGPVAKLDAGVVEGAAAGEVLVFKGLPYAASTAGANRFMRVLP